MNSTNKNIMLHPQLLELLFSHKGNVSTVFNDVLGLHGINHIAISCINNQRELLTLSSTPALEFNLFNSGLWNFDKTYQADWYELCTQDPWEVLYTQERYDELYYIKQLKHQYPFGLSLATKFGANYFIYSIASRNDYSTNKFMADEYDNFYKIGEYCTNALLPLFIHCGQG